MKELITELKSKNIFLSVDKEELVIDFYGDVLSHDLISKIKDNKLKLIKYLGRYDSRPEYTEIPLLPLTNCYPISDAQRRLWVLSQFEGGSAAYNLPGSAYLNQDIDIENFKRAIDATIDRHEILRTVFREDESGEIKQWILERQDLGFAIDYQDLSKQADKHQKAQAYIAADAYQAFDLEKGPLLRAALLQVEESEYIFYFSMHHIISDGWSIEVLSKDVFTYYQAYQSGQAPEIKQLRIQYKDYSAWQLAQLNQNSFVVHKEYWLDKLSGELPLLDLPGTKQRPKVKTYHGQGLATYLDKATTAKLKGYIQQNGGSLFMGLLAAWKVLMYRYTAQQDIIIGTAVAGREHADLEAQIGFYVNMLPLRNVVDPQESFGSFYQALKEDTLKSYSHQMYPFDRLVEDLNLHRDTSRSPVFDVMFILQNNGETIGGVELSEPELNQVVELSYSTAKFDLEAIFQGRGDYLSLQIIFNTDVYEKAMVEGLIRHYKQLLNALLETPQAKLSQVDYLSAEEKHQLLVSYNDTAVAYPKDKTIVDLFEEQAAKTPDHTAVVFEDTELTYRELDEKSNQLAHYLQDKYNIQPDDLVGIHLERSEWMLVSILGVLKAGGAYVPIGLDYPPDRIETILADSQSKVVVDQKQLARFQQGQQAYSCQKPPSKTRPDHLIYVIYTSGSTGKPKGVMLEHKGLLNRMLGMKRDLQVTEADVFLQKTPVTFDVSVWELLLPLVSGSKLVVAKPDGHKDPLYLDQLLACHKVSIVHFVPSMLGAALETIRWDRLEGLRHVVCSGEALSKSIEASFRQKAPLASLHNYYGPTEASIDVTAIDLSQHPSVGHDVLIGKPVDNTRIYIVNENNRLQPVGVSGQILIGGDQVARGYLRQEALSKDKFIASPFQAGERVYKTGDLGRWLPDGNIAFLGRKDNQVKIRGHRIELGEIEQALSKQEPIKQAVVLAKENQSGEKELVAYITAGVEQNTSDLRAHLQQTLPEYMIPVYFVQLEAMPLTASGKVDKKALPDPQGLGLTTGVEYAAPSNEIEAKLVKIWQEVLQRENVGVNDDFFALGGHSLKAIRLSNEYQKELAVKLTLKELFAHTSIAAQAALIESATREAFIQIEKATPQASYPISDAQRRLWVLSQFKGGSAAYNLPDSTYLNQNIDIDNFKRAIDATIARHEILRTVFREDASGNIRQWILDRQDLGFAIDYQDFSQAADRQQKVQAYIAADAYQPFDLERGPLLRAALLRVEESEYVFYFNMHHITSDGWSMEVLSKDVFTYYQAYQAGKQPQIKELRIQYKDYSAWQLAQLNQESFKVHQAYWLDKLSGELPLLDLPTTKQRPKVKTYHGQGLATYLDKATTAKLKGYIQEKGGSLFMGLLASWQVLMYRYTGQKDIIIGSPIAGREHADLEEQIGFYVNTLALRSQVDSQESFDGFYQALKEDTLKSYSHQMYPFDRLVEDLNLQRDTSRSPVFDVLLDFHNQGERVEELELPEQEINQIVGLSNSTSKYDIEAIFQGRGDYLSLRITFNTDVYEQAMVEGLIRHYKQLLNALLETPQAKLSQIDYLSQQEKHQLLVSYNDTEVAYPKDKTVVDLFEEQAAKTPDHVALVFGNTELTYRELNERSNQLAHYLRDHHNIQPDDLVGIQLDRSEWVIIALLGVLKAGGAYLPIDAEYPSSRKEYIVKDSALALLITETRFIYDLDYYQGTVFAIDVEFEAETYPAQGLSKTHTAANLAYVIYTSGSTGMPKGVMVEHACLTNYLKWGQSSYSSDSSPLDFGLFTSLSFDLTVTSIYLPLVSGGVLTVFSSTSDVSTLVKEYFESQISCIKLTPAHISLLGPLGLTSTKIQVAIVGGEKLENAHVEILRKLNPAIGIYNEYGPTEATVGCTIKEIGSEKEAILIGKPVANTRIYIVNEENTLQPVGVTGEILIGGDQLARGYLNHPGLTQERFIPNLFKEGERLYKTGDLGYWLADGNIAFIGRKDDQVKIRGYRVELGEIEYALLKHDQIDQAVVLARENETGVNELVAYLTAKEDQNTSELRAYLNASLPEYMLPAYYVQLKELPLTPNGKIDKKSLPDPEGLSLPSGVEYVAPSNTLEEDMVRIWSEILRVDKEKLGVRDRFFELGGDSIKVIRLLVAVRKEMHYEFSVNDIYNNDTIEQLINYAKKNKNEIDLKNKRLAEREKSVRSEIESLKERILSSNSLLNKENIEDIYPMSDIEKGMVFGYWMHEGTGTYHDQMVHRRVFHEFDITRFNLALGLLTEKHSILRTSFNLSDFEREVQIVHKTVETSLTFKDLSVLTGEQQEEEIKLYMQSELDSIDISKAPLWKMSAFHLGEDHYIFIFQFHHAIIDGWSQASCLTELNNLYLKLGEDIHYKPSILKSSCKEALVQSELSLTDDSIKNYWKSELAEYKRLNLLTDQEESAAYSYNYGNTYLERIENVARNLNTTVKVVSLSAYLYLLRILSNTSGIVTGLVTNKRPNTEDGDKILGCFLNSIPLKFEVAGNLQCSDFIMGVHKKLIELKNYESLSLLEISSIAKESKESHASNPFFDVLFNYIDFHIYQDVVEDDSKRSTHSAKSSVNVSAFERTNTFFDFTISATGGGYRVAIVATKKLNSGLSLEYVGDLFLKILDFILKDQSKLLKDIDYLSEAEKHKLLVTYNDTEVAYPKDKTIVDLFEAQVAKTPDHIAVVFEETELTYQELDERSNQLARYLREQYEIQPDDLVAIKQARSEWMLVSILGVLKAGGAYVPIDPEYPQERIDYIEEDTHCKVCLDEEELNKFKASQQRYSKEPLTLTAKPDNLAYVIYTSGSTGKPKGVMISHGNLCSSTHARKAYYGFAGSYLLIPSFSFDSSVAVVWGSLTGGSSLYIVQDNHLKDLSRITGFILEHAIACILCVPSYYHLLLSHPTLSRKLPFKRVILAGDTLSDSLVEKHFHRLPECALYNEYGPTENTVWSTVASIEKGTREAHIGKPIVNTKVYIVGPGNKLVPIGVTGEICIGGDGLARGYLNQEGLTQEKFIANPFKEGERLYKTGDLGRWLPDGNIEFLGRKDDQVKIRGYRIELAEIEQALLSHQAINQAVVLARANESGEKELVAYITAKEEQNISELRLFVKERLPSYMIPNHFVRLEELPLNANGKVDKKALPDLQGLALTSGVAYVAPRNETEAKLVKIWEKVLQRENIGVYDDFFALGGHSLKTIRLSNEYQKELAVKPALKELFDHTSIASHAVLIASASSEAFVQIEKAAPQASYPISDAQRRLWVLSQFDGGSVAYNLPGSTYLNQDIDIENFKRAIDATIDRHEILRTVFREDESGEIRQWILERQDLGFAIDYQDLSKQADKHQKAQAYMAADAYRAFDLENGPLLRAALLQVEEAAYVFYFNMHHIISDGWSMEVLSKDVFTYYQAYQAGKAPEIKALRIQYKDYSAWQLAQLKQESFEAHKAYWLDKLSGELPLLELPITKQRPNVKSYNGQGLVTYVDKATTAQLKGYVQENGGSLFMGLLAAWKVLMYRYTAQQDIIIGTAVAGREHADLEAQIGFYVNTLALRSEVDPQESFDGFYQALKEDTLKSYSHQMYPFDRLVEDLNLHRDTSRSAVFDVMLILQNNGERIQGVELSEQELNQVVDQGYRTSKFDLEIAFQEAGDYLSLQVAFNTDVYEKAMVEGLISHYKQLLKALLETPGEKISQLDYLSEQEKHQLLVSYNDTAVAYPKDKTIVDLFEEQAARTPDHIAVVFEDTELTYQELNERSNQLAHYLRENYHIQPDDLVGIKQSRSEWVIVSILGVLKAAGAYVPIDPEYPQERIDYIEADTRCKVCLDETELSKFKASQQRYAKKPLPSRAKPDNLAYVIYTSGSTGRPKGVMIEHKNAYSFIKWSHDEFKNADFDTLLFTTSLNFDLSVFEVFHSLTRGKELKVLKDGLSIPGHLATGKKLMINTVPSVVGALLQQRMSFESVSVLNMAGEPIPSNYRKELKGKVKEIRNLYGPSEDTTYTTVFRIDEDERELIGKPIANTQIYILDEQEALQPEGVVGEICIGGDGLARGYLNQEALTQEKFIASPFKPGERLYKTGDLGRWLPDGNIEFVGRKDDQVKIRGYRIELGEIEQALLSHQAIKQAVVLAKANESGDKELVAYITAKVAQNTSDLRAYLEQTLPAYMLPAYFVQLEGMPLTTNGKVDKKSLPDPQGLGLSSGREYVAPRNEIEAKLVKIWQEVLQRENIGVNDDFFALGGHSLKAIRLSNEYQKELAVKLTLKELFAHTSLAAHAALIESATREAFVQIEKVVPQASYPISDAQRRLWVLSQFEGGSVAYHLPGSTYLNQDIDIENFKRAIDATIDRHEILRTVFREDESGEIRQWILEREDLGFAIDYQDFRNEANKQERAQAYIAADALQAFDLEQGPLLRAALLQVEADEYVFYFNMHHIISDGWSMEVLSKDVFNYYQAYQAGKAPEVKALRIQYKDYSAWQLAQLKQESFKAHQAYWLDKLSGELPLLDLPASKQRPNVKSYNGQGLATYLDKATTAKLKGYIQDNGGSLFMGLLASWQVLMYRYTAQQDIIIGTPVAGREHADLEEQIGFYVNTLALRNQIDPQESFDGFYQALKEDTLKSYSHQTYPFDRLVEELNLQRDTSRSAVFDVLLTLQNNGETIQGVELSEEEINQVVELSNSTSKFDLGITAQEIGDYLSLNLVFNPDVYEQAMVEGLIRHYKQLLNALLETPGKKISQIDYLSEQEKHQLLVSYNDTEVAYPKDKTVVDLFEAQVVKTPDHIAVVFEGTELTYQELDEQSNQLAHYLRENYAIQPDDLVGIQLGRSEWVIIAILGVLKAAGAYVPIDPEYPQQRVKAIVEDSNCKVLLDAQALASFRHTEQAYSRSPITSEAKSNNLAYVIYTSGSTGKPKGVMVEHACLTNYLKWGQSSYWKDSSLLNFGLFTSLSFDLTVTSIYLPLVSGGTLSIFNSTSDVATLVKEYFESEINCIKLTPAHISLLGQYGLESTRVEVAIVGGEKLENTHVGILRGLNPAIRIYNEYGPTESTVGCTVQEIGFEKQAIAIGCPIANTQIYILDEQAALQPIGVTGEIYIGGDGLARGYLQQEGLTQERFIASPFKPGGRLYKTGDLARWLPGGNIEFIGRKDDQVKIRGYRIELAEIEQALLSHQAVKQAVVLARANESGEKELVAYITANSEQNINDLRAHLEQTLPVYMLPAYFVQLEAMPLTANGKIDKKSLPDPQGLNLSGGVEYVAPRNETEAKLVKIWEKVLQRENIGVYDDFFALGGHSLKAIRLSNEYQKELAVKLALKELFAHTSLAAHAALIDSATRETFVQIEKVVPQASYPISDAQRRLWVLSQFEGGSVAYHLPGSTYLNQDIDIENFKRAIDATIDRHEILRTVFRDDESGEIRQWILEREDLGFAIDYQDFSKAADRKERAQAYVAADAHRAFDLEQGPLLRAALLQVEEAAYVFYFNMHHIISDGWSMEVLSKDVFNYYQAYQAGKQPQIKELRIQYKDYSAWQLAQLKQESFEAHQAYWLDKLSGELPLLELPSTKQRPNVKTYNGQGLATYLDKATTAKLKGYIQQKGGSLFMGLLTSWNVLMYRYTAQQDIIIGTAVAGREHADLEEQIGFYVNTLALRNQVDPQESFESFYHALKESTLQSYSHQMYPFDRLVEDLNLHRDTSRSPVFDVMLILQNNGERIERVELIEQEINQTVDQGYRTSKFDLEITFQEAGDYLSLQIAFNPEVYEKAMVEGLIRHYKQLLNALLETPQAKISQIDYLSEAEKHQLLVSYNDTAVAYPKDKTIVDLFEEQVAKTPDHIAVVFAERELTYRELNERSNQLAHYLSEQGVRVETLVPICVERGVEMLIGILGILKAGGTYVPIDPAYPQERISYMLADTAAQLVVTTRESALALPADFGGIRVSVDRDWSVISQQPTTPLVTELCSSHLAYVIYTSGSTGNAKGVLIQHSSVVRLFFNEAPLYDFDERDTWTLFHSFCFDFSVWEMYGALFYGGRLVIVPKWITQDANAFVNVLVEQQVTVLNQTPSAFYVLLACVAGKRVPLPLRYVIFGGEALNPAKIKPWKEQFPACRLVNMYGITETTVHVTYQEIGFEQLNNSSSVIGKAIPTLTIFILDSTQRLVPTGVAGEICVGGAGLAQGYLNQAALTAEKFIAHPFVAGERLYRSGDLGRWLPHGNIEYLGRMDDQVKIRGHRIELGEIEYALEQHQQISQAVVLAKANESGEKELVAYITAKVEQNINDLRAYLNQTLPAYMLPAHFVQLEAMPLTANGKVDKKALPDPQGLGLTSGVEYVAPHTEQEKVLVSVWSDVLKRERISIKDSFYSLGGDSIKSIQVVARLKQHGYRLKVEHLLRTPVVEELARLMELTTQESDQREASGEVVLTPIQEWFFKAGQIKVPDHYNQSVVLHSREQLDGKMLEKSIADLTRHHDALRMVYKQNPSGAWQQFNQDASAKRYTFDFYDLRQSEHALEQMARLGEAQQASIKLSEGPLVRVLHFRLQDGDRLGLIIHHLVVDGVSWRILLEDLSTLYASYKAGKKPDLPLKTDSFQRWALLQKEYAASKQLQQERTYWQEVCRQEVLQLPQDKALQEGQAAVLDAAESFGLDKKTTELLQTRVHRVYNTEINDVLLTSLGLALQEVLSVDKSVLKMEGHGREQIIEGVDISRTVGWFTTVYPFVLHVSSSNVTDSLVRVKESLRSIPNKGIGYGILSHLSQQGLESKLTPEITFNYLGDFGSNVSNAGDSLFEYASEHMGSAISKENQTDAILDVSGMLVRGELGLSIRYASARYEAATIKKLAASYQKNLKLLIEALAENKGTYLTPSDLSFKGLSLQELSELNADNNLEDVYELSPLQEGIYYHWLAETSNSLYFEQTSYRVRAKVLDVEKLKEAYDRLTARHAVLRTRFSTQYAGRSLQIVSKKVPSTFTYQKLDSQADKQAQVALIKQQDQERGFDLSHGSQMRLLVIDLSEGEYEFIWSHHHILMDGWCVGVLINDFNELLSAQTTGRALTLAPALPYADYINWLRAIDRESSLGYWKEYLSGYASAAEIPFKTETADTSYVESVEHLQIKGDLFKKIDALCTQLGITHNTFVQAVWGYLLSRYNSTNDVVFGAVVSGRPADLPGVEDMIGLFINTIPVRVQYAPEDTPVTLLKSLQEQAIRSTSHHYMNLSEVQAQSELGMELMDHIMVFENYAVKELQSEGVLNTPSEEGLSVASVEVFERTNYDFNVIVSPSAVSLGIHIKYNLNRYDEAALKRLIGHLDKLFNAFAHSANQPLTTFEYLSEAEKHQLLASYNNTVVAYPKDKTVVDLFEAQVAKTPDHVAVVFENTELTYQELNERSNQLAHYLRDQYEIQPDDLVGIHLDRSEWMVIAILGVLKAGGAYVPIDPEYPQERIDYIEADTHAKVYLDETELSKFKESQERYATQRLPLTAKPDNLAYVIYTSGSTGKPKGVLIQHSSLVNLIVHQGHLFEIQREERILLFSKYTFDASLEQQFLALCNGATLVVLPDDLLLDTRRFAAFINQQQITHLHATPSFLETLTPGDYMGLKRVVAGGEECSGKLVKRWSERGVFYNEYGPTETTVTATVTAAALRKNGRVTIGKPLANLQIYVVEKESQQLVPAGVVGEICIGGDGLARGYLNQEALTREKFIANPFKPGERLYKTGDLGRWLADGNIEFLGRKDDQVKIRGYRIELGEIEQALLSHQAIKQAVVIVKKNQSGEKELVAYVTANSEQNINNLRAHLEQMLPAYMLPAYFVQLEAMPLTANGKIDKKSLPDPQGLSLSGGVEYVAPRNEIEEKLMTIWEEVLQRKNIGMKDNFFALGGHSLKALKVMFRVNEEFKIGIKIANLFTTPSIEDFAILIAFTLNRKKNKLNSKEIEL